MRRLESRLLERYVPLNGDLRVLDAGCGAGIFLAELTALRGGAWSVGGDVAEPAVRLAMQTGVLLPLQLDVRALPFAAESFDLVVSNDVLQHLGDADALGALNEARRVLRPGGTLLLRTAARRGILWKRHRDGADYCQRNRPKIKKLLAEAGLEPRFTARANWLPGLLADARALFAPRPTGDVGLELDPDEPDWKARLLEGYWGWERRLLFGLGLRPPLGHTLVALACKPRASLQPRRT
jgi:SAM-dependent methyltransferase